MPEEMGNQGGAVITLENSQDGQKAASTHRAATVHGCRDLAEVDGRNGRRAATTAP